MVFPVNDLVGSGLCRTSHSLKASTVQGFICGRYTACLGVLYNVLRHKFPPPLNYWPNDPLPYAVIVIARKTGESKDLDVFYATCQGISKLDEQTAMTTNSQSNVVGQLLDWWDTRSLRCR